MPDISDAQVSDHADNDELLDAFYDDIKELHDMFTGMLSATDTWDPASISDTDAASNDVTVTGASLGDFVMVSCSLDVEDLVLDAQVTAADTVTVVLANNTGGAVDLGSATFNIRVIPSGAFDAPADQTVSK